MGYYVSDRLDSGVDLLAEGLVHNFRAVDELVEEVRIHEAEGEVIFNGCYFVELIELGLPLPDLLVARVHLEDAEVEHDSPGILQLVKLLDHLVYLVEGVAVAGDV